MATPVDFPKYLQSLVESYKEQQHLYTLTDLQVEVEQEIPPEDSSQLPFPKNKSETKIARLEVLTGIRKYVQQGNVLLVGKPGSGKSTVLQRFRWELALEALENGDRQIPVLVQLRSDRSIVQAICAEFRQAKLRVSDTEVEDLLFDGKLLLLLDGVNEMPSQQRRQELQLFRDENSDTRMIFTTRDLALGGFLGIEQQLQMCALTQPQMREFVHKHLPQHGDLLLGQLRDRLPEVAETPLLLWMLCKVFKPNLKIPHSKGELFQEFDRQYEEFKGVPSVSDDFRRFKPELLQQLAFAMLQGDSQQPTDGWVAISRDRAEGILERWLGDRGVLDAPTKAKEWLEDLLEHHLLQVAAKPEEIEFHHQLFQEYYAARALRKLLVDKHPDAINDERLKHFYLNYFKWTEPLAFMLSLLQDEAQAVRVVRLALEVDLMLGARLAGEVQREFQKRTVGLVDELDVPGWLKVELLGVTRSDDAIPGLLELVEDSDSDVRSSAVSALGAIGSEAAIPGLLKLVEDSDSDVRSRVADALGKIGSEAAIPGLLELVKDSDSNVYASVAYALGKIGFDAAISELFKLVEYSDFEVLGSVTDALEKNISKANISKLFKLIKDPDSDVRMRAANALGEIGSDEVIPGLVKIIKKSNSDVAWLAADVLGQIGSDAAIIALVKLVKYPNKDVRASVANALGESGSIKAILGLLQLVEDPELDVRWMVVNALGQIGSEAAIPGLIKLLKDSDYDIVSMAAELLGDIGSEVAIPGLLKLLEDSDTNVVSMVAYALGELSYEEAIPGLLKLVKHSDKNTQKAVVSALKKIGSDEAIPGLRKLLKDSDSNVRIMVAEALENIGYNSTDSELFDIIYNSKNSELIDIIEDSDCHLFLRELDELGEIGSEEAIPRLLKLMEHSDSEVRWRVANALGEIGSDVAIVALLDLVQDPDSYVCWIAADILSEIGSEEAITGLIKLVQDPDYDVRWSVTNALGNLGSEVAIPELIKLVEDANHDVRSSAADALGKIAKQHTEKVAPHLPHLLTLIRSESGEEVHRLILAIQTACKYYNYEIRQLPLLPESGKQSAKASANVYIQSVEKIKLMSNEPPIFNQQNATIGVNYAAENSNPKVIQKIEAAQQSSPDAALNAVVQIIQALEKKYTNVQDEQQARNIIDAEFKEIKEQKPIEWQNLINVKRLYNGGKNAAVKVGEHFAESSPWVKGFVGFLEGISEDVN